VIRGGTSLWSSFNSGQRTFANLRSHGLGKTHSFGSMNRRIGHHYGGRDRRSAFGTSNDPLAPAIRRRLEKLFVLAVARRRTGGLVD